MATVCARLAFVCQNLSLPFTASICELRPDSSAAESFIMRIRCGALFTDLLWVLVKDLYARIIDHLVPAVFQSHSLTDGWKEVFPHQFFVFIWTKGGGTRNDSRAAFATLWFYCVMTMHFLRPVCLRFNQDARSYKRSVVPPLIH